MHSDLVSHETLRKALKNIVDSCSDWKFYVTRSKIDWETGKEQTEGLILDNTKKTELDDGIDPRLVRSRHVHLGLEWKDQGAAVLDITNRSYTLLTNSNQAKESIETFEKELKSERRRQTSSGVAAWLCLYPFAIAFLAYIIASIVDPAMREYMAAYDPQDQPNTSPPMPPWSIQLIKILFITWPVGLLAAAAIGFLRYYSGGLRISRPPITRHSVMSFAFRVKSEILRIDNWRNTIPTVLAAVIGAVLGMLLKR